MRIVFGALVLLIGCTSTAAAAEPTQYLCVVDQATGFGFDPKLKRWTAQTFPASSKYILRRVRDEERDPKAKWSPQYKWSDWPRGADWAFFSFGDPDPFPLAVCQEEFGFSCKEVAVQANFDRRSQRFEIIKSGTYTDQGFWKYMSEHDPDGVDEKV